MSRIYSVSIQKKFIAKHFLPIEDEAEKKVHSHDYRLTVKIQGDELNENGFLIDIVRLENIVERTIKKYRDSVLNEIDKFKEKNPTLENFSRIFCEDLLSAMRTHEEQDIDRIASIEIVLWENEEAKASYREEVRS